MRNGIKILISIFFCVTSLCVQGQVNEKKNWQHLDLEKDGVFGISADKLYQQLNGKKGVPVIVAVIDGGADTSHEDLKGMFWSNPKEIPGNKKDDDKNGYVDDIHGWNFLGSAKGSFLLDNYDLIRQLRSALKKDPNSQQARDLQAQVAEKKAYYEKALAEVTQERESLNAILTGVGKPNPSVNDLQNFRYKSAEQEEELVKLVKALNAKSDPDTFKDNLNRQYSDDKEQLDYWLNINYDPRKDKEFTKPGYGNGDIQGQVPYHCTHVSGIIAANRNNNLGGKGIADNVKLMILRTIPVGDYLDSEMALAIRYAADNGARVINISAGKIGAVHPELIDQAVQYAMDKDVLIVHACGNDGQHLDQGYYPRKEYQSGGKAKAWIEVGASGMKDDESLMFLASNYGKKVVDVFAPGVDIYSCTPNNGYAYLNGTSMAAPVVSGLAAVLRSYYPKLSAETIKEIIIGSVKKVNHNIKTINGTIPFSETCSSGGIVNLYDAFELAAKR